MRTTAGFKAYPLEINRDLKLENPDEIAGISAALAKDGVTDLIVISHGWRNDIKDAQKLYDGVLGRIRAELARPAGSEGRVAGLDDRRFAVLEVYWPAKRSADAGNIPGGAASAGDAREQVGKLVDEFALLFAGAPPPELKALRKLAPDMDEDDASRREFVALLRKLVRRSHQGDNDAQNDFFKLDGAEVVKRIGRRRPSHGAHAHGGGGAAAMPADAGGAAGGVGDFFGGLVHKVKDTLDIATYYTMKERAGDAGAGPVNATLRDIRAAHPEMRFHLIGHSFGGRLVTAAAMGNPQQKAVGVATLTLLQAAFSHYGFSQKYEDHEPSPGYFRPVLDKQMVSGPILASHSRKDTAVGMAYPIASRLAGQNAAEFGDARSPFGGIGRNGAQKTDAAVDLKLGPVSETYGFAAGRIYNLEADDIIKEHSDIARPEVAHAWAAAVAAATA